MSYHRQALQQYSSVGVQTAVGAASPYQLVQMLLAGALDRIAAAKGHMQRESIAAKGQALSRAIAIVASLRNALNHEKGGELAGNLERLYDYIERRLAEANLRNDVAALDEAARLLGEVKAGWDAIPPQVAAAAPAAAAAR